MRLSGFEGGVLCLVALGMSCAGPRAAATYPLLQPPALARQPFLNLADAKRRVAKWGIALGRLNEAVGRLKHQLEYCAAHADQGRPNGDLPCVELGADVPLLTTVKSSLDREHASVAVELARRADAGDQVVDLPLEKRLMGLEQGLWEAEVRAFVLVASIPGGH